MDKIAWRNEAFLHALAMFSLGLVQIPRFLASILWSAEKKRKNSYTLCELHHNLRQEDSKEL